MCFVACTDDLPIICGTSPEAIAISKFPQEGPCSNSYCRNAALAGKMGSQLPAGIDHGAGISKNGLNLWK